MSRWWRRRPLSLISAFTRDYKPELQRLAKERDDKRENEKQAQLARLMADMKTPSAGGSSGRASRERGFSGPRGAGVDPSTANPFGPHGINEREDRYYDEDVRAGEAGDDEENDDEFGPDAELERPGPGPQSRATTGLAGFPRPS